MIKHLKVHERGGSEGKKSGRRTRNLKTCSQQPEDNSSEPPVCTDGLLLETSGTNVSGTLPSGYPVTTNYHVTYISHSHREDQGDTEGQGHSEGHYTSLTSLVLDEELNRYNNSAFNMLTGSEMNFEQRNHGSYYENLQNNSSQGLEILTTALDIVNPTQY